MFSCEVCNYMSSRKYDMDKHYKTKKHIEKILKEEEDDALRREQKKHFVCPKCGKRFPKQQNLTRHNNRKKPCVEIIEVPQQVQPTTVNNNQFNIYLPAVLEHLYKDTTYDHITTEFLINVLEEFDRGDRHQYKPDEIRIRYKAFALLISKVHWDLNNPENRNFLALCILPWVNQVTSTEYLYIDVDDNGLVWRNADTTGLKNMMISMIKSIQNMKQFDLSKMINFAEETLNDTWIGHINKVLSEEYHRYTGRRMDIDKRYSRFKMVPKDNDKAIKTQYLKFRNHECMVSNNVPMDIKSSLLLTNS